MNNQNLVFYTYAPNPMTPSNDDNVPQLDLKVVSAVIPEGVTTQAFVHALELLYEGRYFRLIKSPDQTK